MILSVNAHIRSEDTFVVGRLDSGTLILTTGNDAVTLFMNETTLAELRDVINDYLSPQSIPILEEVA